MFGPLNGVRIALVAAAVVAALVALVMGFTAAALVLMVGVAVHGAGWLYLYRQKMESGYTPDSRAPRV